MGCERFFTEAWLNHCRRQAERFFVRAPEEAEEACANARLRLWEKFGDGDCEGLSDAYVRTAYANLLRDAYRRRFGRPRPPQWVTKLGPLWQRIFELFCLQRLPADSIAETLAGHADPSGDDEDLSQRRARLADLTNRALQRLREERACPETPPPPLSLDADRGDGEDGPGGLEVADPEDVESGMNQAQTDRLIAALVGWSGGRPEADRAGLSRGIRAAWDDLAREVALDDDERLLLRLVYQEERPVTEAARLLDRPPHQVRRPLQRALQRIRTALEARGLGLDDLLG